MFPVTSREEDVSRLQFERDLYRSLLDLSTSEALEPFLDSALDLVMSITGSRQGLLGLGRNEDDQALPAEWWTSRTDEGGLEGMKRRVSSAIVRQSLKEGRTVETPSAFLDPRFEGRESVRSQQIESVLCVPIGDRLGVVYLEGHRRTGRFPKDEVGFVELFAKKVELIATRLLVERRRLSTEDPTREYRTRMRLDSLVGASPVLAGLFGDIEVCARSKASVLLTGPSGTGKTHIAQVIHNESTRSAGRFVALNCAAVPEELMENELFGFEEGAHATAFRMRPGHIEAAQGGTLFLDEVAELSMAAQAKLLQVLNDKVFFRLGSTDPQEADVRFIAATNADLEKAVEERRFRADLFFRLEVLPIQVPPLAERRADIPLLIEHYARVKAHDNQLPVPQFSPSALAAAEVADWPGNIRELAHLVERAVVRAAQQGRTEIDANLLFDQRRGSLRQERPANDDPYPMGLHAATRIFQRSHIKRVLKDTGGNMSKAAKHLEIARSHLYSLKKTLDLEEDGVENAES